MKQTESQNQRKTRNPDHPNRVPFPALPSDVPVMPLACPASEPCSACWGTLRTGRTGVWREEKQIDEQG